MRADVYGMSDEDLVLAASMLLDQRQALELPLTDWETSFCDGVVRSFRKHPSVSWRQRKTLREIVSKGVDVLEHRRDFDEALSAARGLA